MNDRDFVLGRVSNATLDARRSFLQSQISNLSKRTFQPEKTAEVAFQTRLDDADNDISAFETRKGWASTFQMRKWERSCHV